MFKPITTSTEKIVAATERISTETEKIAKRTKQVKKSLKTLPTDIVAAQSPTDDRTSQSEDQEDGSIIDPTKILSTATIREINQKDNINDLARYAVETYKKYENPNYNKYIGMDQWYKKNILCKV